LRLTMAMFSAWQTSSARMLGAIAQARFGASGPTFPQPPASLQFAATPHAA